MKLVKRASKSAFDLLTNSSNKEKKDKIPLLEEPPTEFYEFWQWYRNKFEEIPSKAQYDQYIETGAFRINKESQWIEGKVVKVVPHVVVVQDYTHQTGFAIKAIPSLGSIINKDESKFGFFGGKNLLNVSPCELYLQASSRRPSRDEEDKSVVSTYSGKLSISATPHNSTDEESSTWLEWCKEAPPKPVMSRYCPWLTSSGYQAYIHAIDVFTNTTEAKQEDKSTELIGKSGEEMI